MYRFAKGIVLENNQISLDEKIVNVSSLLYLDLEMPDLIVGQNVFVSWSSESGNFRKYKGKYYINRTAIEPVHFWDRKSSYKPRFQKNSFGHEIEKQTCNFLNQNGIRAEQATDYEDEVLGVDIWVLLKSGDLWRWFPVDITLRRDVNIHYGEKFNKGFGCGVLVVRVIPETLSINNFLDSMNKGIENFILCGKDLMDRHRSKKMEEDYIP